MAFIISYVIIVTYTNIEEKNPAVTDYLKSKDTLYCSLS